MYLYRASKQSSRIALLDKQSIENAQIAEMSDWFWKEIWSLSNLKEHKEQIQWMHTQYQCF